MWRRSRKSRKSKGEYLWHSVMKANQKGEYLWHSIMQKPWWWWLMSSDTWSAGNHTTCRISTTGKNILRNKSGITQPKEYQQHGEILQHTKTTQEKYFSHSLPWPGPAVCLELLTTCSHQQQPGATTQTTDITPGRSLVSLGVNI